MKKIFSNFGWDEITTKRIVITLKIKNPISTAGGWVDFCRKKPSLAEGSRVKCDRCALKWENCKYEASTYLCQTTKGNKILCQECFDAIDYKMV